MKYTFAPTPNPNSLKITAAGHTFIDTGLYTFRHPTEVSQHPLGALLLIEGVVDVLVLPAFVTVTKAPTASWKPIQQAVTEALDAYFATR